VLSSLSAHPPSNRFRSLLLLGSFIGVYSLLIPSTTAQEIVPFLDPITVNSDGFDGAHQRYLAGEYDQALKLVRSHLDESSSDEKWWRLESDILLLTGRYEDAYTRLTLARAELPESLWLMMLRKEAARYIPIISSEAIYTQSEIVEAINYAAYTRGREATQQPDFLAALSLAALRAGVEPKLVLENFLKPAQTGTPASRDAFLIAGQLALDKQDPALASRTYRAGLENFPSDPDLLAGLAASFRDSDRQQMVGLIQAALAQNPRQIQARLLMAEHQMSAEDFGAAQLEISQVTLVNPHHPEANALLAAIALLQNRPEAAAEHRAKALAHWETNPKVDHVIGQQLSQRYRFTEGAAAQRLALSADPLYVPAQVQLARDLLRLGEEEEGWFFANLAHERDGYNIDAFNLTTLRDRIEDFATVESDHFRIRMSSEEAIIYGNRALTLLEEARVDLTARYGIELSKRTTVEIYPNSQDFAVRTFGMPGIGGYLGVCFGSVFTVNSPASQRANWESVLWHEFAHVITLTMSENRMPRWLSEGISVFEEVRRDPSWGQRMSADYYRRIIAEKTHPVSRMSAAFMEAEDQAGTIFAYYQSYLVVEYLISKYGFEPLKKLLRDLGDGTDINVALAEHFAPLEELDDAYAKFALEYAQNFAPEIDLTPKASEGGMFAQLLAIPDFTAPSLNFDDTRAAVQRHLDAGNWVQARETLEPLLIQDVYFPGPENIHMLEASISRELNDTEGERAALLTIVENEAGHLPAVTRLLAIAADAQAWDDLARWSDEWLAIDPLGATPWRARLNAHTALEQPEIAIAAGETLLRLDPPDRVSIHHQIAELLEPTDPLRARRHVLQALEDAPRFRAAYELLDRIPAAAVNDSR
jgi:hypothetical protein